jgi:hypothetical protein
VHWNPKVVIIFCAAARYRRTAVGSSHDDAHPDNSTLHAGAVRPHNGFVESLFFKSPRSGNGSSQEHDFRGHAPFVLVMVYPYFK